jgi:hypothetical protein
MRTVVILALAALATLPASVYAQKSEATSVRLEFRAASDSFAAARDEYEKIWAAEGRGMIAAMELSSGLRFVYPQYADTAIVVTVREEASSSGFRNRSGVVMRASYSADTKRTTLMHELGHRLMAGLFRRDDEEHDELFLWLYDAWILMVGRETADEQVAIEKRRGGPYPAAWDHALKLSADERAAAWKRVLDERLPTRR